MWRGDLRGLLLLLLSLGVLIALPGSALSHPSSQDQPKCAEARVSPLRLLESFYDRAGFPEHADSYTGEMLEHYRDAPTLGSLLPDEARVQHRPVLVSCERAIYATTISTDAGGEDWYVYLAWEGGGWKIEAVRKLALPGIFSIALGSLVAAPDAVDQRAALLGEQAPQVSGAEMLANMRLVASTDAALKAYFAQHQDELLQLVSDFEQRPSLTLVTSDGRTRPEGGESGAMAAQIRQLHLNAVYRNPAQPGCAFVSIGGVLDNEVGYLYAPPGCAVPEMSPNHYILIEPIATGWFLFKTT
jgi:hypothetical protein